MFDSPLLGNILIDGGNVFRFIRYCYGYSLQEFYNFYVFVAMEVSVPIVAVVVVMDKFTRRSIFWCCLLNLQ
jgi:hypothetical protein